MNMISAKFIRLIALTLMVFSIGISVSSGQIMTPIPDRESRHHSLAEREARGDGASGAIAALLLGIANSPVVLSLLLKASAKIMRSRINTRETIRKFNLRQKKSLMWLHYWINPLAIGVAILHFSSSECRSTAFPEIGLIAMTLISALGLLMTFRLSPASISKAVFRLHTNPVLTAAVLSILLIGHLMID